ncbi:MAG: TerB family tellurite resistance protein [Bacteroidales bacterium]|nr:TerB family tellurite resistance protein [Bacteroidales bacterium]
MLTQEEFEILVLLYAANIDGNLHEDEMEALLNKFDAATFEKMHKQFKKMSDMEVLACIKENKEKYVSSDADRQQLMDSIRDVIMADRRQAAREGHLLRVISKLLN